MTDQTAIGYKLPAAPGGWKYGRARDDSSIKSQLPRPGRMLGVGRGGGQDGTNCTDSEVTSGLPLTLIQCLDYSLEKAQ